MKRLLEKLRPRPRSSRAKQDPGLILERVSDCFFSLDTDWRFTYANSACLRIMRRTSDGLLGRSIWTVFPSAVGTIFESEYRRAMREQRSVSFTARDNAHSRWIDVSAYPASDGLSVYFRDVTDRIETEENAQRELHETLRAREDFISIAGHELRAPVTTLSLQLQLLARTCELGGKRALTEERITQAIQTAQRQIGVMSRMIDDLMDVTRISNGKLSLEPSPADFCDILEDVLEHVSGNLVHARCPISLRMAAAAEGVWDRRRIEQVIVNLVLNAAKYGAGKPIDIELEADPATIRLSVKDQGIGIRPEDHDRIFRKFERAKNTASVSGLGLGLYIAEQIVTEHGGRIALESEVGRGSTFIVYLPRITGEPLLPTIARAFDLSAKGSAPVS